MAPLPSLCPSPTGISTSISTLPPPFAMPMPVALSEKVFRLSCLFYIPKLSVYFWQGGKSNTASDKRSINRVYAVYNTYSWQLVQLMIIAPFRLVFCSAFTLVSIGLQWAGNLFHDKGRLDTSRYSILWYIICKSIKKQARLNCFFFFRLLRLSCLVGRSIKCAFVY